MDSPLDNNEEIAFAADTQAPMLVETLWLRAHRNRTATGALFRDVHARRPAAFFLLGDVVNLGYSTRQWKPIDRYLQALRKESIPVHAIMGNHEVMGQPLRGERKFNERFPDHVRTGFVVRVQHTAVILLNSNFGALTRSEAQQQQSWLGQTLQELDEDPNVQFVITCCHHSPFTNSRIVRPSADVEKRFVPLFLESKKSSLFLSGHCHAFEHYQVGGKTFLVIGGGGGLPQPLRQGLGALTDLASGYKPMFHYITVRPLGDHLKVISWQINKDFSGFEEGLQVPIPRYTGATYPILSTTSLK